MVYVPSFLISFISTTVAVEDKGGAFLEVEDIGIPLSDDLRVFVDDGTTEHACYSGVSGQGYTVKALEAGVMQFVVPPLAIGGPYDIVVRSAGGGLLATIPGVLDVVARNWESKVFDLRRLLPPWYKTGPRRVDIEDLLE